MKIVLDKGYILSLGISQKNTDVIKAMLENKLDYEIIEKVTKTSIEEIKEIEKSIKSEE